LWKGAQFYKLSKLNVADNMWLTVSLFKKLFSYRTLPNLKFLNIRNTGVYIEEVRELKSLDILPYIFSEWPMLSSLVVGLPPQYTVRHNFFSLNAINPENELKELEVAFFMGDALKNISMPGLLQAFPKLKSLSIVRNGYYPLGVPFTYAKGLLIDPFVIDAITHAGRHISTLFLFGLTLNSERLTEYMSSCPTLRKIVSVPGDCDVNVSAFIQTGVDESSKPFRPEVLFYPTRTIRNNNLGGGSTYKSALDLDEY